MKSPVSPRVRILGNRRLAVLVVGPLFALVTACSGSLNIGSGVSEASDVSVGECVTVKDSDDGKVEASKTDCEGSDDFTFYVASKVSNSATCSGSLSTLSFEEGNEKACLTPNLASGKCYQVPSAEGGGLADFKQVDCGATAAASTVIVEVSERGTADVACTSAQTSLSFTEPESIGYCLTVQ